MLAAAAAAVAAAAAAAAAVDDALHVTPGLASAGKKGVDHDSNASTSPQETAKNRDAAHSSIIQIALKVTTFACRPGRRL